MPIFARLFLGVLSRLPWSVLHALGAAMGWAAFLASPTYRKRLLANIAQAGYAFADVRSAVAHAGRLAAEIPRLWMGAQPDCSVAGEQCVLDAYAQGRGIVFLTPHLGSFELSSSYGARRWGAQHGPITVLYRPARQPWLARMMQTARDKPYVNNVPTTLAGVRQMLKALRQGQAVGLLPDQVPPVGQGVWAPFFGRDAYTMTLAARLARQSGAAIILARCERLPRGAGFALHLERLQEPLPQDEVLAATQINRAMESVIRQSPQQYLWGYARYKQPRADRTKDAA